MSDIFAFSIILLVCILVIIFTGFISEANGNVRGQAAQFCGLKGEILHEYKPLYGTNTGNNLLVICKSSDELYSLYKISSY